MLDSGSLFAAKLLDAIRARKAEIVEQIAYSRGVSDFAAYQRLVGHIAALDEVLEMFSAVQNEIAEEGRRK